MEAAVHRSRKSKTKGSLTDPGPRATPSSPKCVKAIGHIAGTRSVEEAHFSLVAAGTKLLLNSYLLSVLTVRLSNQLGQNGHTEESPNLAMVKSLCSPVRDLSWSKCWTTLEQMPQKEGFL